MRMELRFGSGKPEGVKTPDFLLSREQKRVNSFFSFVDDLTSRMSLDPKDAQKLNDQMRWRAEDWMSAVKLDQSGEPVTQKIRLPSRVDVVLDSSRELPDVVDKNAYPDEKLNKLAIELAKIQYLKNAGEDLVPAQVSQTELGWVSRLGQPDVRDIATKILKGEDLDAGRRKLLKAAPVALAGLLTACGGSMKPTLTPDNLPPTPIVTAEVTEVAVESPSATPVTDRFPELQGTQTSDGKNVTDLGLVTIVDQDPATGLTAVLNKDGDAVLYKLPNGEWVLSPLIDQAWQKYGFEKDIDGDWRKKNVLSEYPPILEDPTANPYFGPKTHVEWQNAAKLPSSFWDEGHSFPAEGALSVVDADGNIYMYISPETGSWVYAGTRIEMPGGLIYEIPGEFMERWGVQFELAGRDRMPESSKDNPIRPTDPLIRQSMEWWAMKMNNGYTGDLDQYRAEEAAGIKHTYTMWGRDAQTGEVKQFTFESGQPNITVRSSLTRVDGEHSFPSNPSDATHEFFETERLGVIVDGNNIVIEFAREPSWWGSAGSSNEIDRVMGFGTQMPETSEVLAALGLPEDFVRDGKRDTVLAPDGEFLALADYLHGLSGTGFGKAGEDYDQMFVEPNVIVVSSRSVVLP